MELRQLVIKYYQQAVKNNNKVSKELKRALKTNQRVPRLIDMITVDLSKVKDLKKDDIRMVVTDATNTLLYLLEAKAKQTAWQDHQAKQDDLTRKKGLDKIGLDDKGNGTVDIDGYEVTIRDKETQTGTTH